MKAELVELSPIPSRKQLHKGLFHLLNTLLVVNEEGVILDINGYAIRRSEGDAPGSLHEWIGKHILSLSGFRFVPRLKAKIESLLSGQSFSGLELSGSYGPQRYWARVFGAHCRSYVVVGFEDITQQKLLESESFAAIQKFQSLFDAHPDAVFCFDASGYILNVNDSSLRISGYKRSEMIGTKYTKLFHRNSHATLREHTQKLFRGQSTSFEADFIKKDGSICALALTFIPISGKGHIDGYYGIARDVTEKRRLSRLIQDLKDEYEDLFENAPLALIAEKLDAHKIRVISRMNRKAEEVFGKSRQELVGKPLSDLVPEPGYKLLEKALKSKQLESRMLDLGCLRFLDMGAEEFPSSVSINRSDKEKDRTILSIEDVSVRKSLESSRTQLIQELKESHQAIERKSKLQQLVLRMLGHDFRSPFNSILGGARLLMEMGLTEDQKELVAIIHRSAQHELKLIDNLLKFSQIEEGNIQIVVEPVTSEQIVQEIQKQFVDMARQKHIDLVFQQVQTLSLAVDTQLFLRNVLTNVVHNAIKYSFPGQNVTVEILKQKGGKKGLIRVTDTGLGMPEEIKQKLFEITPSKNRAGTLKEKSTGFGLYIAYQITRLMGGDIQVESFPDQGTTVCLEVPLADG
jgi:PAS domain S-box-containing protein